MQFYDLWTELYDWLDKSEKLLDDTYHVGNDPEKIKSQIVQHREFQRMLGAKQPQYDSARRLGRSIKDKSPKDDHPPLNEKLTLLKSKWNSVCTKSVDR